MTYELNSSRRCIKVYSTSKEAEQARSRLLEAGVPVAWADDTRNDIADGFGVWVQERHVTGAYTRLMGLSQ